MAVQRLVHYIITIMFLKKECQGKHKNILSVAINIMVIHGPKIVRLR